MDQYRRYAIYYAPPAGALADFGASWLGWDLRQGCEAAQPDVAGIGAATRTPRKYGFHGTLKAPFRLAPDVTAAELAEAAQHLAERQRPFEMSLEVTRLGPFLALCPVAPTPAINALAAACVTALDRFRAPLTDEDRARRRIDKLSPTQRALLEDWGYPYVLQEFRFHMTLTGPLDSDSADALTEAARAHLPDVVSPLRVDRVILAGEAEDGQFHALQDLPFGSDSAEATA